MVAGVLDILCSDRRGWVVVVGGKSDCVWETRSRFVAGTVVRAIIDNQPHGLESIMSSASTILPNKEGLQKVR